MSIKGTDKVDYRYLNLDRRKFCDTQVELTDELGGTGMLRAIPNRYGQVLIAGSNWHFTEAVARYRCNQLVKSGLTKETGA